MVVSRYTDRNPVTFCYHLTSQTVRQRPSPSVGLQAGLEAPDAASVEASHALAGKASRNGESVRLDDPVETSS